MSDTLTNDERTVVTARVDRFRRALIMGGVTDWAPFLDGVSGSARRALLTELAVLELNYRWARGERPRAEEYLARFPELSPAENVPLQLVIEEYRCRLRAGESVNVTEYRDRFPGLFPTIQTAINAAGPSWTIAEASVRQWEPVAEGLVSVAQQYELVRELGRGMFGEVWLARKKPSGIEKAIKVLMQPADRAAGQRELKAIELIKNLRHPYLLATEDFWIANNRLHVVMELADGTLRGLLKHHLNQGRVGVPLDELFRYITEAAEGLDYLHEQKIVHRDVKPDNILILHGHAKLADFGLARAQEHSVESMSLAGTPAYMAPEIWGGEGGPASDLYSLAAVYAELRQGRSPIKPHPVTELLKLHPGDFEFTDTITEPERAVLRRALARQPHHRFPTCTAFVAELAVALGRPFTGGSGHRAAPPGPAPSLSAIFGDRTDPLKSGANETLGPGGTVVSEKKPRKRVRPSAARIITEILAILSIPIVIGALVWFVFFSGQRTHRQDFDTAELVYPPGTTPEEPATEMLIGKKAPVWVFVEKGGEKVRFRLIAPQSGPQVAPFYISETKITNKLYSGGDDTPVMNVSALAARAFAQKEFNGDLPSDDEWDHAAGFFDQRGQSGPTLAPGRAWINKPAPGSSHRAGAEADINQYGLLDMAGNGREWTRTVLARNGQKRALSSDPLADTDKLVLRGRMFTLGRPLSYAILEKERTAQPQAATPGVGSPYTGFRVVLKLP
jgi:serine/threonine protein kinase